MALMDRLIRNAFLERGYREQMTMLLEYRLERGFSPRAEISEFMSSIRDAYMSAARAHRTFPYDAAFTEACLVGEQKPPKDLFEAIIHAYTNDLGVMGELAGNIRRKYDAVKEPANAPVYNGEQVQRLMQMRNQEEAIAAKTAREEAERKQVAAATNVRADAGLATFAELVDRAYENGITSFGGLIQEALNEWKISPEALGHHLSGLNGEKDGKTTISDTSLYQYINRPEKRPQEVVVSLFVDTFRLQPDHEAKMWRIIAGNQKPHLKSLLQSENHGELVTALHDASGIPSRVLQERLGVQQLNPWRNGARIEDPLMAKRFIDEMLPDFVQVEPKTRDAIYSHITQRPLTITDAMESARNAGNPGGKLFQLLAGKSGLVALSEQELLQAVNAQQPRETPITGHAFHKMRHPEMRVKGGGIFEKDAEAIVDVVADAYRALHGREITASERKDAVDMLTSVPSLEKLLQSMKQGEITAGDVFRQTRERKNLTQQEVSETLGRTSNGSLSHFERTSQCQHETAREYARWLNLSDEDTQHFVVHATQRASEFTAPEILQRVQQAQQTETEGTAMSRVEGLRKLLDMTGLTNSELADELGLDPGRIMYARQERSDGNLIVDELKTARELAQRIGVDAKQFIDTFVSVSR